MTEPATTTPKQPADSAPARKTPPGEQGHGDADGHRHSDAQPSAEPAADPSQAGSPADSPSAAARTGWWAVAAMIWLIAALLINRVSLSGGSGDFNLVLASTGLPMLVEASVLAGVAVGLWTSGLLAERRPAFGRPLPRLGAGVLAGLLTGAFASGAVLLAYGIPTSAAIVMAIAVGVAGGIGGGLGTLRPSVAIIAAIIAGLAVVLVRYVIMQFNEELLNLFGGGAGATAAERFSANGLLAGATALLMGLAAGVAGFVALRRLTRAAGPALRWPAYLAVGGSAAVMLVIADLFSRIAVPMLLSMAAQDVSFDLLVQAVADSSRLNTFLVVFFVGAITSMIAFGRTLPKRAG
jgi:hypothetical protein